MPQLKRNEVVKEEFYSSLEKLHVAVLNYDIKTLLADFKAKVGQESHLCPACGGHSLNNKTNDNGKQILNSALGKDLSVIGTWLSTQEQAQCHLEVP
jgi:hypothetical protein